MTTTCGKLNDKMYEYLDSVKLSDLVAQQATRRAR